MNDNMKTVGLLKYMFTLKAYSFSFSILFSLHAIHLFLFLFFWLILIWKTVYNNQKEFGLGIIICYYYSKLNIS